MFMIEKSLIVIIFIYITSFSLLGAQYIWADAFHITMTNFSGVPLKNNLIADINSNTFNKITNSTLQTNQTNITNGSTPNAANIAWDLILLISGVSIFDVLSQLGVPTIFVAGFLFVYFILVARSVMGWIRGI